MITTYKFRIKSTNIAKLDKMACAVNFVWNYCNEVSLRSIDYNRKYLSGYDLNKLTSGCGEDLGLNSQTIQAIGQEYVSKRNKAKKKKLAWRSKRSLGWIPFKQTLLLNEDVLTYYGHKFRFWKSREVIGKIKCGSFNQDSRGRWYVNIVFEVPESPRATNNNNIGIDLGLKTTATYSDGGKFEGGKHYRRLEQKLATSKRANKKRQSKGIFAKISNCRKDELHKETNRLINTYDKIFIGDVSSLKMVKTKNAKSALDAGWGMFRSMLAYKAIRLGVEVIETKENFSTVTCSVCNERSGPSGLSGLGVREWDCSICGTHHDRDVNAAKNILAFGLGHQAPKGIST